ncbi:hypothetical protein L484_026247 [Morus notabilis]|uniref:Uncharacterized protein n=1 Tax=Morus notabilis TaxID=981085 RepID=W9RGY5_9ROSA|nr:hypothetical protein L484_026247 [Morus notabilis]
MGSVTASFRGVGGGKSGEERVLGLGREERERGGLRGEEMREKEGAKSKRIFVRCGGIVLSFANARGF